MKEFLMKVVAILIAAYVDAEKVDAGAYGADAAGVRLRKIFIDIAKEFMFNRKAVQQLKATRKAIQKP